MSRNASRNVEESDPIDYWYRLGQRNAFAQAAALHLAPELGEDAFSIGERITAALDAGASDVNTLRSAAYGLENPTLTAPVDLAWIGPNAFERQYGHLPGTDRDYGMRWGARGDQRVSLRLEGDEATQGLLYAWDPTWQEYAVLAERAPRLAVDRTFRQALDTDVHLPVESFAHLVHKHSAALAETTTTPAAEPDRLSIGAQL
ncbi:hypothetical protein [Humibacillus xanthopallidus]|uniref:hypothetical protein n=1 Tax=Humibacillus xanthopallidus TaxID=412689 RepID=UPI00115081C5|nr:hypothetical protein [Humibacillus xanthopallidus]